MIRISTTVVEKLLIVNYLYTIEKEYIQYEIYVPFKNTISALLHGLVTHLSGSQERHTL